MIDETTFVFIHRQAEQTPVKSSGPLPTEPAINGLIQEEGWRETYKARVAHCMPAGSLSDQLALEFVSDIVNLPGISNEAAYHMLDALQMLVWNAHPRGLLADVIETINNEMEALTDPDWRGRYGEFVSVRQQSLGLESHDEI